DPLLGRRRRIDGPLLGIDGPPALAVAVHHPAADAVDTRVLDGLLRRAEHNRLAPRAQDTGAVVEQDHAVAGRAVRHGGELYTPRISSVTEGSMPPREVGYSSTRPHPSAAT